MIVLFVTVLVIPLTLILGGMAIDLSALGTLRDRLQVAADASATAAASAYHWEKTDPLCVATCDGAWVTNADLVPAFVATNGQFTIDEQVLDASVPKARVRVSATLSTSFLRLLGIDSLSSSAMAEAIRRNVSQEDKDAVEPVPGKSALVK